MHNLMSLKACRLEMCFVLNRVKKYKDSNYYICYCKLVSNYRLL